MEPAGVAAYRAWKVFGRHLLNKAAIEQAMRWCKEWVDGDEDKPRPEPGNEGCVPTVEDILQGPVPAHRISRHLPSITDALPGPLPPPSTVTGLFASALPVPSSSSDVVSYAHFRHWAAAGCALVASALLYLTYRRPRPHKSEVSVLVEPATPDTTKSDASDPATPDDTTKSDAADPDPDAADETSGVMARAVIILLLFSALNYLGPEGPYA